MYIPAVDRWNLKSPTREGLQWQISMSLAYGCQGIQYFTYWIPVGRPGFEFGTALIAKDGRPSRLDHDATAINPTYLQPIGRQLKHLVRESVLHANEDPLPAGTTRFTTSPQSRSAAGERVVATA
jgi:hypothetical protein